ncbi:hypothetical protein [Paludisphaera mucosa]|uniref:Uncharacterized protein n=1 Tax=Paludisphaera mucosa TaxID=3030827 RepID=A0ABT6F527_9BACT|nr:hypothetical protein [Paludisphaera mucosa]MDG3002548.1 hypothetical protein [Paludisphaera mucosa]
MEWLNDTSMGPPGWSGHWPLWLSLLFHLSNLITAVLLIVIPTIVLRLWNFRLDGYHAASVLKVLAFLPAIGVSKALRIQQVWGPPSHLASIFDCLCAVVIAYSACHLPAFFKRILLLPSRDQFRKLNQELRDIMREHAKELPEMVRKNHALCSRVDHLQAQFEHLAWNDGAMRSLAEIRSLLVAPAYSKEGDDE